jgi:hypothetical protein
MSILMKSTRGSLSSETILSMVVKRRLGTATDLDPENTKLPVAESRGFMLKGEDVVLVPNPLGMDDDAAPVIS